MRGIPLVVFAFARGFMRSAVSWRYVLLLSAFLTGLADVARAQSEAPAEDVAALRSELAALQKQVAELAAKIEALQGAPPSGVSLATPAPPPAPPPVATAELPAGLAGAEPAGAIPVYGNAAASSKVFNPDIAVIGDFLGAMGTQGPDGEPSLELHEAELSFQAIVDPYARADFFLVYGPDEVGVEEGFLTFPALPGGFLAKIGKMRDVFGKVDGQHNHVLPFTDRPLVTKNLTGGEDGMSDYGITLSRLIPNPWLFLEATGQVYRGRSNVFDGTSRGDLAYVGHLRAYRDVNESSNVDLGGSFAYGSNDRGPGFHTRLLGVDATYRWRPLRRAIYNRFLARTELVWSRREEPGAERNAFGLYASGEYQFARRWFVGARYDFSDRATDPSLTDKGGSFLLTYWPSEFSQVRGQYRRTRFGEGQTANEFLFQFLFSIGAHGAHAF
jgi:hypothetical protein